jgi:hypothetical protein
MTTTEMRQAIQSEDDALRAEYLALAVELLELQSQNDSVNATRENEISDRMEDICTLVGANREVIITVRGGVAEVARNTDDEDILVTIIDYDDLDEHPMFGLSNDKDSEVYTRQFEDETEARHWVINHLDLSKNWTITKL